LAPVFSSLDPVSMTHKASLLKQGFETPLDNVDHDNEQDVVAADIMREEIMDFSLRICDVCYNKNLDQVRSRWCISQVVQGAACTQRKLHLARAHF